MGGGNDYYENGFFNYNEELDWSNGAILPQSCYESDNGPMVVYSLYKEGHNQCGRKCLGTYQTKISAFLTAYAAQQTREAEITGNKFEGGDAMQYLYCVGEKVNDVYFYYKLGCRESTGKGFQVHAYNDPYCSQRANVYNNYIDTSVLQVSFDYCKSCVYSSYFNKNANGNNNNYNNMAYYYGNNNNNNGEYYQHASPLCSAMYNYQEKCGYSCKRNAKKASSGKSSSGSGSRFSNFNSYNDSYNPIEIAFLWVLSLMALFFLLKGLSYRKKFSRRHREEETMAIDNAGFGKENVTRAIILACIFITLMIVFKRKILIWFSLGVVNIMFISYYLYLKRQSAELTDQNEFTLYEGEDDEGSVTSRTVRKIYTIS